MQIFTNTSTSTVVWMCPLLNEMQHTWSLNYIFGGPWRYAFGQCWMTTIWVAYVLVINLGYICFTLDLAQATSHFCKVWTQHPWPIFLQTRGFWCNLRLHILLVVLEFTLWRTVKSGILRCLQNWQAQRAECKTENNIQTLQNTLLYSTLFH